MRKHHVIFPLVMILVSAPGALARKGNWDAVEKLSPGVRISVKTSVRLNCYFVSATDNGLVCSMQVHGPEWTTSYDRRFERRRIKEVRVEYSEATGSAVGAAVGGGVGAILGGVAGGNGTITRGGGALLLGGLGAIVGGIAGRDFPLVHGDVIYRRSDRGVLSSGASR